MVVVLVGGWIGGRAPGQFFAGLVPFPLFMKGIAEEDPIRTGFFL
jgi:hypothetical protein